MDVQEKRKMKRWLWPLLLFVSMFFVGGCDSDEDFKTFDGYETLKLSEWNDDWNQYFEDPWVHWETYKNQEGVISKQFEEVAFGIKLPGREYSSYFPVNISQVQLEEGMEIIFSGEVRDHPYADFLYLPLILTNIQIKRSSIIK